MYRQNQNLPFGTFSTTAAGSSVSAARVLVPGTEMIDAMKKAERGAYQLQDARRRHDIEPVNYTPARARSPPSAPTETIVAIDAQESARRTLRGKYGVRVSSREIGIAQTPMDDRGYILTGVYNDPNALLRDVWNAVNQRQLLTALKQNCGIGQREAEALATNLQVLVNGLTQSRTLAWNHFGVAPLDEGAIVEALQQSCSGLVWSAKASATWRCALVHLPKL